MAICIAAAGVTKVIAASAFVLSWTHSVEKSGWIENWVVESGKLQLTEARVKGSGAGMDPGQGAALKDGWWVWTPQARAIPEIALASAGATGGGWKLCYDGGCVTFGELAGDPIVIHPCDGAPDR
jgi:hypothetical protein